MNAWLVRKEGAQAAVALPSAEAVIAALRDGQYDPTDEVKGPNDPDFMKLEVHPAVEEAASEVEFPPVEERDDTHLDMNPLIDVCLVLLIFFILTITYESLKRSLDLPELPKKQEEKKPVTLLDIKDQVVVVQARMSGDKVVIKVDKKDVPYDDLRQAIGAAYVGKKPSAVKELVLDVEGAVPWGVQTSIMDAAKANGVERILYPPPKIGK